MEVEFAFRIGRDIAPRDEPYGNDQMRSAIAAFLPAMELVGSRFSSGLAGSGRSLTTADGGAHIAFVHGAERALPQDLDLASHPCHLEVNGERIAEGTGQRALDNPLNVLTWLGNYLAASGKTLSEGELVTTGTCTGLVAVKPGDALHAEFGALGNVRATLIPLD